MNKPESNISPELFAPQPANAAESEKINRPIITYFKDAMLRLSRNKVALVSLSVIIIVALGGILGPFFFPQSPDGVSYENAQNPDYTNQDPSFGSSFLVTDDYVTPPDDLMKIPFNIEMPQLPPEELKAPGNLTVQGEPSVNGVTLQWDPIEGVNGYYVYRISARSESEAKKLLESNVENTFERGVQLDQVPRPDQYTYTDAAGLDASEVYVYSVVPYIENLETGEISESPEASTVLAEPVQTMRISDAVNLKSKIQVGDKIAGRSHIFGTDSLGRDVFARTLQGTRIAFLIALVAPFICIFIGLVYGASAALVGGKVDLVMMRINEILSAIPDLLVLILLQLVFGSNIFSLIIALSLFSWLSFALVVRAEVMRLREIEFVQASRLLGASTPQLIGKHIAPNLLGLIIVFWSNYIPRFIAAEAFLTFIGLGIRPPDASWGNVLLEAGNRIQANPLQFFMPVSLIGVSLLAFFLLGDALRDAFDPKLRGRE